MSQDEIVFDEIKYREPHRLRRPDRDRRWAVLAYEIPAPDDLPIFLDRATADVIERHALRDTSVELGGILLGKECVDDQAGEPFVWVTRSLEAKHYENTQASFTYTHDSWEEITREHDRLHPDLDVVGWYHTHPDFGIFLSSHDLFIQHHFFGQPLQVAYVVDPIRQTRGFFRWRGGQMEQVKGFYLSADRGDRVALVRLVNDLENIAAPSDPGAGGGGLSPRLEAELIAMLTRPVSQHLGSTAADRAQLAALFGMIGAAMGVILLAAVLWLNQLYGSVQAQTKELHEQSKAIDVLEKAVRESADRERLVLDAAFAGASDTSAEKFLEQYTKASRQRDEAESKLAEKQVQIDLLAAKTKSQGDDLVKVTRERDRFKVAAKEADEAEKLRAEVADLRSDNRRQAGKIDDLLTVADTVEGKKATALLHKYQTTWYAAVAGWVVSLLLALGMAAGYALLHVPPEEEPGPARPMTPGGDTPPHRIV